MSYRWFYLLIPLLLVGATFLMVFFVSWPSETQNTVQFEVEGIITKIETQKDVSVDGIKIHATLYLDGKPTDEHLTMPRGIAVIEETSLYRVNDSGATETITLEDLRVGDHVHCWVALKTDHLTSAAKIVVKNK